MRAAVLTQAQSTLEVIDLEPTPLEAHEVMVETGASGLCHSDASMMQVPDGFVPLPMVMGHEGAGTVVEVGAGVRHLRPGDRVIATWVASCGRCHWCTHGQPSLCAEFGVGADRGPWRLADGRAAHTQSGLGTMAELMIGAENAFVKVETDLPDEQLALVGCGVATGALAAIRAAPVQPGDSVAVFGCGGVGSSAVQGSRIAGAAQIIGVDSVAMKRDAVAGLGATTVIDSTATDPIEAIRELTGGRGVDVAIDAGGSGKTATWAVEAARKGGIAVCLGGRSPSVESLSLLNPKTIKWCLYGDTNAQRDFPMLVGLAEAGELNLDAVVTRRLDLDDVMSGFESLERGEVLRSVICF